MNRSVLLAGILAVTVSAAIAQQPSTSVKHVKVYYERGMFGGWPANLGIWHWDNEILVGFSQGYYKDLGPRRHHIDREKTQRDLLARSLDGGETWSIEDPGAGGVLLMGGDFLHGLPRPDVPVPPIRLCPGGIDFTHPDFALTVRTDGRVSAFFCSYDRGHTWTGPYRVPMRNFGIQRTAARTDYLVNSSSDCMLFITAAEAGETVEGWPICMRTTDGGASWDLLSRIGERSGGSSIMPASVRLSESEILVVTRRRDGYWRWLAAYLSVDNGRSWQQLPDPVESTGEGNPPALILLQDGRLCLTYGYRGKPFSIRAKLSEDKGHTWSEDIVLRDDGANRDIGYTRCVQRPDGKVVVVYYFNDLETGPERYIGATIWTPPAR